MTTDTGPPGRRALPSVDRVLRDAALAPLLLSWDRESITHVARRVIAEAREGAARGEVPPDLHAIVQRVRAEVETWVGGPGRVINATGVILHTNLGRAPLSPAATAAVAEAVGYTDLEVNLVHGKRGTRQARVASMLAALTGAEAAHVATSNAAAVLLALLALVRGRDVIVSRGQAVEIGGGFRVPAIMRQSGARLVEVGTTNRTRLEDYAEAISPRTGAILHVHRSNFKIVGFTEDADPRALAALAHEHGVLLLADNGSGPLVDTAQYGLPHEPTPMDALRAGADVVTFSGDKLLGGPQAGLMVGSTVAMGRVAAHPVARAVRPDKLQLAALTATLRAYLDGSAPRTIPVLEMLGQTPDVLAERAARFQQAARRGGLIVDLVPGRSPVGGGSLPDETLPTTLIRLPARFTGARLRSASPPILPRMQDGRAMLDLRTVEPRDEETLLGAVLTVVDSGAR
ncbi:MAG TPA: L-seryl-tRNA(Sec) selenium transferase [Chloroflexota bacterium]|nr:L-seryl-tRNA(Sec) selenium transferase [Chloroflexota bacterium]